MSMTTRSASKTASQSGRTEGTTFYSDGSSMHPTGKGDQAMSRLAATRQLEREQAERSERIRIHNLYVSLLLVFSGL